MSSSCPSTSSPSSSRTAASPWAAAMTRSPSRPAPPRLGDAIGAPGTELLEAQISCQLDGVVVVHLRHRSPPGDAYHRPVATAAPPTGPSPRAGGLAALTPSGRAVVPAAWALYDLANTIFTYSVVSYAMGLWHDRSPRAGRRAVLVRRGGCRQRPAQRDRVADPGRRQRPRRPAAARTCWSSPRCRRRDRPDRVRGCGGDRPGPVRRSRTSPTRRPSSTTTPRSRSWPSPRRAGACRASGVAVGYLRDVIIAGLYPVLGSGAEPLRS